MNIVDKALETQIKNIQTKTGKEFIRINRVYSEKPS